jgi:hypothetical protein
MKVRLVWSTDHHHYKHLEGRFWFRMRVEQESESGTKSARFLLLNLRRLVLYLFLAGLVLYLGLVTAVYLFLREPSGGRVGWWRVALPLQWKRVTEITADESVTRGMASLKAQHYVEGMMQIESGLRRAPGRNDGRLELARFYLAALVPTKAITLLDKGRGQLENESSALELAGLAGSFTEDFEFVLRFAEGVLAVEKQDPVRREMAQAQRLQALVKLGRKAEALAALQALKETKSAALLEAQATVLWENDRKAEAEKLLAAALRANPEQAIFQDLHARGLREAGQIAELERELDSYVSRAPMQAERQLLRLRHLWLAGLKVKALSALEAYMRFFDSAPANLVQASRVIAQLPSPDPLFEQTLKRARELGQPCEPQYVAIAESRLLAGDLAGIKPWLQLLKSFKTQDPQARNWLEVMENVVVTQEEGTKAMADRLVASLRKIRLTPAVLEGIIQTLHKEAKDPAAQALVSYGQLCFPNSARFKALEQRYKTMEEAHERKEEQQSLVQGRQGLGEAAFLKQLDSCLESLRYEEASALILDARRQQPEWLQKHSRMLRWKEVQIANFSDDTLKLQAAVREYLKGGAAERAEVFSFAQELWKDGKVMKAELVVKEIIQRQPEDAKARAVLKEMQKAKE